MNPTSVLAATDLFQRQLIATLPRLSASTPTTSPAAHVATAATAFIQHGLTCRAALVTHGIPLIRPNSTVILPAPSRAATVLLLAAAASGTRFRVLAVSASSTPAHARSHTQLSSLRAAGISTAMLHASSLARALRELTAPLRLRGSTGGRGAWDGGVLLLGGAAALLSGGDVLAGAGTSGAAALARERGVPVWIAAEGYKCARGARAAEVERGEAWMGWAEGEAEGERGGGVRALMEASTEMDELLDVTPAGCVTGVITEAGLRGPVAVAEEAVAVWF